MHKLENEMKLSNRNYRLFEPRDETRIAATMICQKLILLDGILLDHRSIREYGDVSTASNIKEEEKFKGIRSCETMYRDLTRCTAALLLGW